MRGGHFVPAEMPALCAALTAASKAALMLPALIDMEMTPRVPGCAARSLIAHSMPSIAYSFVPRPLHPSTITGTMVVSLATPTVVPATVPAQCVPCQWQFLSTMPSLYQLLPQAASLPVGHAGV